MADDEADAEEVRGHDADRLKFFTDAVVAIAMTLLILPLLESVSDAAGRDESTARFLSDHQGQFISFVISFAVIAGFWTGHERLFAHVGAWNGTLVWLNVLWMLTIVFLPVATAMSGSMTTDALQIVLYVGTMLVNAVVTLAISLLVRGHPALWEDDRRPGTTGVSASAALVVLFAAAMALAIALPANRHYYAMFLLLLTGPVQAVIDRILTRRERSR